MAGVQLNKFIESLEAQAQILEPSLMNQVLGRDLYPRLAAKSLALSADAADAGPFLDEIPSETTPYERRFLFGFFSRFWNGKGDVLEIGPFLGGTSRAIAHGMLRNPRLSPGSMLHTFDKFSNYYDVPRLIQTLEPLIAKGALDRARLEGLGKEAPFKEIFDLIHSPHPYGRLIQSNEGSLPDSQAEVGTLAHPFRVPPGKRLGVVFVDGCKSWLGTKEFMRQVLPSTDPGGFFVFQDYGWFTCFWIPAFTALFNQHFELVSYADNTYAFQYRKPLSPAEIDRAFPDTPEALGRRGLEEIFSVLRADAVVRCDGGGLISACLQHVAVLAYIGEKDAARALFKQISEDPSFRAYAHLIKTASISPAYRPEGKVYL